MSLTSQRPLASRSEPYTRRRLLMIGLALTALMFMLSPHPAAAQDGSALDPSLLEGPRPEYLGVRPGINQYAPGKRIKAEPGTQVITWVGFQANGDRGRVFIQMNTPPIYEVATSRSDQVILDFPSARLHTKNDMNELDTGFFPTVVRSVRSRQVGKQLVRVVIQLREPARYRLKKDDQILFLYFDPPREPIDVLAERERELEQMAPREGSVLELKRRRAREGASSARGE